ncbi:MAG: phage terminase large subunit family protein [Rickettsiaceae bacterium]|nr:phage terminase large subunit family protein [Rickettsiaceae bacterium]
MVKVIRYRWQYFWVPCPECNEHQVLKWSQIRFENNDPATARYICEHCGAAIKNHQKAWMLEHGQWRALNPAVKKVAGFHLSSLYSPVGWFSWNDAVARFLVAKDNEELLKVWVNTVLGETWVDKGEAPDWERLFERAEDYRIGLVPESGLFLTAGADIQKDRIEVEVVAWGKDRQSWSVEYKVYYGDPARFEVWEQLSELLQTSFEHESGISLPILMMAVDSGYATQEVYQWVRKAPPARVIAIKGVERAIVPLGSPNRVDVNTKGKRLRRGAKVWPVGVSILKSEFYHWLKLTCDEDGVFPSGYCHFPKYAPEYFKQVTAEQLVTRMVKGYPKREWQKIRERNEALDCRIYARAAAIALGVEQWSDSKWQKIISSFAGSQSADATKQPAEHKNKSLAIKTRKRSSRSNFMSR